MAKTRVVNTRFWSDNYVSELDPVEKLLFLYILTNPFTNICGIYEITLRQIALDTGLDSEMIRKIFTRLQNDRKVYYVDGWVYIRNFAKHQKNSPSVQKGIERAMDEAPEAIKAQIKEIETQYIHSLTQPDTASGSVTPVPVLIPELEPIPLPIPEVSEQDSLSKQIVEIIRLFKEDLSPGLSYGHKTQRKACEEMIEKYGFQELVGMCQIVIQVQGQPYAPRASTPYMMWQKIGDFKSYFKSQSNQNNVAEV